MMTYARPNITKKEKLSANTILEFDNRRKLHIRA